MKLEQVAKKLKLSIEPKTPAIALQLIKNYKFRETLDREALVELLDWTKDASSNWEDFFEQVLIHINQEPKAYASLFDREIMLFLGLQSLNIALIILQSKLNPAEDEVKYAKIFTTQTADATTCPTVAECMTQFCIKHPEITELVFSPDMKHEKLKIWRKYLVEGNSSPVLLSRILGSCKANYQPQYSSNPYELIWSQYIDKIISGTSEEQQQKFLLVGESQTYAQSLITLYCSARKRIQATLPAIVVLGKKWANSTQKIIRKLPKDDEHLPFIEDLVPSLKRAAQELDLMSQLTLAFLHFTGITKLIPHDTNLALRICMECCEKRSGEAYQLLVLFADCYRHGHAFTST